MVAEIGRVVNFSTITSWAGGQLLDYQKQAERGELDLDAPVATYWPEFAAEGKHALPVKWLLSHRAGLPALERPFSMEDVLA